MGSNAAERWAHPGEGGSGYRHAEGEAIKAVGFNGPPVKGACGIRSPLYFDTEIDGAPYFFVAPLDKNQEYIWDYEVARGAEEGHLTLCDFGSERVPGSVVVYASKDFFEGTESLLLVEHMMDQGKSFPWGTAWYTGELHASRVLDCWSSKISLLASEKDGKEATQLLEKALVASHGERERRRSLRMLYRRYPEGSFRSRSLIRTARIFFTGFPNAEDMDCDWCSSLSPPSS